MVPCNSNMNFYIYIHSFLPLKLYEVSPFLRREASAVALQETQRDVSLIPESGRSPGGGHGTPLQYSCLENPIDRGAWQATYPLGHKESDMTERHTFSLHE